MYKNQNNNTNEKNGWMKIKNEIYLKKEITGFFTSHIFGLKQYNWLS